MGGAAGFEEAAAALRVASWGATAIKGSGGVVGVVTKVALAESMEAGWATDNQAAVVAMATEAEARAEAVEREGEAGTALGSVEEDAEKGTAAASTSRTPDTETSRNCCPSQNGTSQSSPVYR